jgi:hypothetical protein
VCYNNPLTQTIVNNKYTKSHNDLLIEEASPKISMSGSPHDKVEMILDLATAYSGDETRDGGMTPGPFEEMRRRIASLSTSTPIGGPAGIRKRKRKEKKRNWVWTINQEDYNDGEVGGAIAAMREAEEAGRVPRTRITAVPQKSVTSGAAALAVAGDSQMSSPMARVESHEFRTKSTDVEMSDSSSFTSEDDAMTPCGMELDEMVTLGDKDAMRTPVAVWQEADHSTHVTASGAPRRDTPVPESIGA